MIPSNSLPHKGKPGRIRDKIQFFFHITSNNIYLDKNRNADKNNVAGKIKSPFHYDRSDQFIHFKLFIPGQKSAFQNFPEPGYGRISKVANHGYREYIF